MLSAADIVTAEDRRVATARLKSWGAIIYDADEHGDMDPVNVAEGLHRNHLLVGIDRTRLVITMVHAGNGFHRGLEWRLPILSD